MSYAKSARFYDAIYHFKDYAAEVETLRELIGAHGGAQTLLDVATGTGAHLAHLHEHYTVEGLDKSSSMLAVARERLPGVPLHQADMVNFELGKRFDVITCLFSAIGYLLTVEALEHAIATFTAHLNEGGIVIVEPWLSPEVFRPGHISIDVVNEPDLKISRVATSTLEGEISVLEMHHLVATPDEGVTYFVETHHTRLFTREQYLGAFARAGLRAEFIDPGLTGRGLTVGVKS